MKKKLTAWHSYNSGITIGKVYDVLSKGTRQKFEYIKDDDGDVRGTEYGTWEDISTPKEPCKCELKQQAIRDRTKAINKKILADGNVKEAIEALKVAFQNQEKAAQDVAAADQLVALRSKW